VDSYSACSIALLYFLTFTTHTHAPTPAPTHVHEDIWARLPFLPRRPLTDHFFHAITRNAHAPPLPLLHVTHLFPLKTLQTCDTLLAGCDYARTSILKKNNSLDNSTTGRIQDTDSAINNPASHQGANLFLWFVWTVYRGTPHLLARTSLLLPRGRAFADAHAQTAWQATFYAGTREPLPHALGKGEGLKKQAHRAGYPHRRLRRLRNNLFADQRRLPVAVGWGRDGTGGGRTGPGTWASYQAGVRTRDCRDDWADMNAGHAYGTPHRLARLAAAQQQRRTAALLRPQARTRDTPRMRYAFVPWRRVGAAVPQSGAHMLLPISRRAGVIGSCQLVDQTIVRTDNAERRHDAWRSSAAPLRWDALRGYARRWARAADRAAPLSVYPPITVR